MSSRVRAVGLDHVVLRVRDIERTVAFYRDLLQLELVGEDVFRAGKRPFLSVRVGASLIDLIPDEAASAEPKGMDHLCLEIETDDLESAREWLEEAGVQVDTGPTRRFGARGDGMSLYVRDPDGYVLELKRYED